MKLDGDFPFHGEVVWLTAEQGGRMSGPPRTPRGQDYAATAHVPPATVGSGLASIVIRATDRMAWRSAATAAWLVVENDDVHTVEAGTVLVITEGPRDVAYFHVRHVTAPQTHVPAGNQHGWLDP